jgi:predicted ATPase/DNA-binding SARP family transcriptional activator/tetratricopeptide (TPR) repeat protein
VHVGILGPLEVRDGRGDPVEVAGARLRALLVRLALDAGRPIAARVLVDAVWGEQPPADEANALQTLVSRLRRALGDAALVGQSPAGYRLAMSPDAVDATRFAALASDGARALRDGDPGTASLVLREALGLWRGPALVDAGTALHAAAARLEDQRVAAVVDRVAAEVELGQADGAVPELDALAGEHPLDERIARQQVLALAAAGRQADALRAYERIRERLADELGVDPSAELQAAHLAVLRGQVDQPDVPAGPRRTNLRAQLTSFVGRDEEVARVGKALEENRLVTIVGPGGAGKTRLATEAGAKLTAPDGVWLAELAPVTDPGDIAQTVLGSLGVRETHLLDRRAQITPRDALSRLQDSLADRCAVLILDNCEHLVEASARLVDFLLGVCPRLRVLTTSREPLAITGEALVVIPPLGQPGPGASAAEALEFPAVRLFADRAAAVRPDFAVNDETVAAVVEIVRRLDGLPLAIELAAARMRALPLSDIEARLSDRFRLLTGGSRTAMPRHRTLRAVVEWSWDLLGPAERLLAERLAVFPAGATVRSASEVCSDDLVPDGDIADLLASLVDKSLLQPVGNGERFRMLETLREYGVERLAERGELAGIRRQHAEFFAALVVESDRHLRTAGQLPWMRQLTDERENLLASLRILVDEGEAQRAVVFACSLGWFWMFTGAHADAATWLRYALTADGEVDDDLELLAHSMLAVTAASGSNEPDADELEAGLARLRQLGQRFADADTERYPMLALMRPVVTLFSGDQAAMEAAVDDALGSSDEWVAASAQMFRSNLAENEGDVETMRVSVLDALARFTELGERWGLASCLQVVGQLHTNDGLLDEALASYQEAMRLVGELGAHDDQAWLCLRLADVHVRRGELAQGLEMVQRANDLSEASGSARDNIFGRVIMADVLRRTGDVDGARRLRREAEERLRAMPDSHPMQSHGLAVTLGLSAKHHFLDGEADEGERYLATAYETALATRDMPIVAAVGSVTALRAVLAGDPVDAAQRLGASARLRGTPDHTQPDIAELTAGLRGELGDNGFERAFEAGRSLTRDAAIDRLRP